MNKNMRIQKKYDVMTYDGHEVIAKTMQAREVKALKPKSFDHYVSTCTGDLGFMASSGKWVEYHNKWPGLGPVGLAILQALQLNAGDYLTPAELAELTGYDSLRSNEVLAARIHAIRKLHRDKGERFIETRTSGGYAVRWPKERTWLWINRIVSVEQDGVAIKNR